MLLVAAVPGLAGCQPALGYDSSLPTGTTTATAKSANTVTRTSAGAGPEAEILAGYRSYWNALITAGATADADSPLLPAHAVDIALAQARAHFAELKRLGQVDRGTVALHPKVVAVQDRKATVEDCPNTDHWLRRDAKSGAVQEAPSHGSKRHVTILLLVNQTWKVATITGKEPCES
jgi:hypothetical protein